MENGLLLTFVALYLAATLAIGWWASRRVKTTSDFVVAGRRLPMFMVACALFATWFGSETVMGASSEFAQHGLLGVIEDPFGAALCLILAGLLVARPLYKLNILTFNDFFRLRFNKTAELTSACFMVPSYFSWITAQLIALALVLQSISGLEKHWGVLICTSLVLVYTYIGGMWSVAITDFIQTIIIILGMVALAVEMVLRVGGWGEMIASAPPGFFQFLPNANPPDTITWVAAWMTIGLGSIPQQDVFQRVMSAKSEQTSVRACYLSGVMYLSIAMLPLIVCFCGRILYPELLEGDTQMMIPSMVLQHSGPGMQILFFGALMSAILSTCSGAMLAPATVIGENLVRPLYKEVTDKQLLQIMRWAVVFVAVVTGTMAVLRENIYELVGESSALSLVSLFTPLMAGLYWKKASAGGAVVSMLAGMAVWLLTLILLPEPEATGGSTLSSIPPMLWGFGAGIAGMVIGTYLFPNKENVAV